VKCLNAHFGANVAFPISFSPTADVSFYSFFISNVFQPPELELACENEGVVDAQSEEEEVEDVREGGFGDLEEEIVIQDIRVWRGVSGTWRRK
jgi:hypothetical protein